MKFYLGTHRSQWLGDPRFSGVPLFVSRRVMPTKKFPRAVGEWALDSGGFTELNMFGGWQTSAEAYVAEVRRLREEIGGMAWAAPQDWMCEPVVLQKTGLDVRRHQELTVLNFMRLKNLAPDVPFVPVLQGWSMGQYEECFEMYARCGIDLAKERVVGIGTVCRRQHTEEVAGIVRRFAGLGLRIHGFGVKKAGLAAIGPALESADSMAWSFRARRSPPLPGHEARHKNCASCPEWALGWRERLMEKIGGST